MKKFFAFCKILGLNNRQYKGFSLVEMLMALLVASLLMVALAPVMTKKFNETVTIGGGNQFVHEVAYNSPYCPVGAEPKKYDDGTEYCEGEFTVPMGVNKIEVTLVGAGGGGAAAATAGMFELTEAKSEDFTVPQLVNELETTLVSGGAGGGAGGQIKKSDLYVTYGKENFTETETDKVHEIPSGTGTYTLADAAINHDIVITACGGGGGGGGTSDTIYYDRGNYAYGGGSGGYVENKIDKFNVNKFTFYIGGGGGLGMYSDHYQSISGAYQGGLPYGGGSGYGSSGIVYPQGMPAAAIKYTSSLIGGTGGEGYPREHLSNCGCAAAGSSGIGWVRFKGADGGQPNGGNGQYCGHCNCVVGGSGGGGAATQFVTWNGSTPTILFNVPGGGGGASPRHSSTASHNTDCCFAGYMTGGGGGGGEGGGAGGNVTTPEGSPGTGGGKGSGSTGGKVATIFGDNYCNGGDGGVDGGTNLSGYTGKSGAFKITYLDYGPGGSGGGTGMMVPAMPLKNVVPGEILTVKVGSGTFGGKAGAMKSDGNASDAQKGRRINSHDFNSVITRGGTRIFASISDNLGGHDGFGGCPSGEATYSSSMGICSTGGMILCGSTVYDKAMCGPNSSGFKPDNGWSAGNIDHATYAYAGGAATYAPGTSGGKGGQTTLFGKTFCEPGYGGKSKYTEGGIIREHDPKGGDATGYGGCGGGGGYSLHDGGKGADGYARITWNKNYIRGSVDEYKYAEGGSGGGGSAGNVFRYSLKVQGGDVLKYKVGKGGTGGKWAYVEKTIGGVKKNVLEEVPATNGGMTELKTANNETLRAGGGLAGAFPLLTTALTNGLGGAAPNLCEFINSSNETESFIDKEKMCTNKAGGNGTTAGGGKGADAGFNAGKGGANGATGVGLTANGADATGFGAGGGGAGLYDLGNVAGDEAGVNPSKGGDGGNGKIIFRWK